MRTRLLFTKRALALLFISNDGFALVFNANRTMIRVVKVQPQFTPVQYMILGWKVKKIERVVPLLQEQVVHFERYGYFQQDDLGISTAPNGDKVGWFKIQTAIRFRSQNKEWKK